MSNYQGQMNLISIKYIAIAFDISLNYKLNFDLRFAIQLKTANDF
jgi:hypothetical protein